MYVCTTVQIPKVRSGFFYRNRAVRMMRCVRGGWFAVWGRLQTFSPLPSPYIAFPIFDVAKLEQGYHKVPLSTPYAMRWFALVTFFVFWGGGET